jgi:hypothetical protein
MWPFGKKPPKNVAQVGERLWKMGASAAESWGVIGTVLEKKPELKDDPPLLLAVCLRVSQGRPWNP